MSVVHTTELTYAYESLTVGPLSFSVEPGYCVAVVGPNGSGKSTLFRMLAGVYSPATGEVSMFGGDLADRDPGTLRRMAYIPDGNDAVLDWTVGEAAKFQSHFYPTWSQATFSRLVGQLDIDMDARFKKLSQGQQRRALFALGLACETELLLADEPTTGVDPFTGGAIMAAISESLEREDRAVIFSTHSMEEVRRYADYVLLLADGHQRAFVEKDTLLDDWHVVWLDRPLGNLVPGIVDVDAERPTRLLTNDLALLKASLSRRDVEIQRVSTPDLAEVLRVLSRGDPSRNQRISSSTRTLEASFME